MQCRTPLAPVMTSPLRVLPYTPTTCPWVSSAMDLAQFMKQAPNCSGVQTAEHSPEGVVRRDAVGQPQEPAQPLPLGIADFLNFNSVVCAADHAADHGADGDDDEYPATHDAWPGPPVGLPVPRSASSWALVPLIYPFSTPHLPALPPNIAALMYFHQYEISLEVPLNSIKIDAGPSPAYNSGQPWKVRPQFHGGPLTKPISAWWWPRTWGSKGKPVQVRRGPATVTGAACPKHG